MAFIRLADGRGGATIHNALKTLSAIYDACFCDFYCLFRLLLGGKNVFFISCDTVSGWQIVADDIDALSVVSSGSSNSNLSAFFPDHLGEVARLLLWSCTTQITTYLSSPLRIVYDLSLLYVTNIHLCLFADRPIT